jgi:branched-chain amino acid transport system substrate-binding protein
MLAHRTPVIGGVNFSFNAFTNPMFYAAMTTVVTNVWAQVYATTQIVKAPKLGSLLCSDLSVCAGAVKIISESAKQLNVPIVYNGTALSNAVSYTPECLAMKAAGANVIIPTGVNNVNLIRDCHRQGYFPTVMVTNYNPIPNNTHQNPDVFAGQVGPGTTFPPFAQYPQENGNANTYFEALQAYLPGYLPGGADYNRGAGAVANVVWASAQVFAKAITNAGVPAGTAVTRNDVIRGLSMFNNETLGGISPPLTYSNGTTPNPQITCFYLYKSVNTVAGLEMIPSSAMKLSCQTLAQANAIVASLK